MRKPHHISILGGGPCGLSVGYYASKSWLPFTIYEASENTGGNAITLKYGDFLFDSGAHRFHDKEPEITEEIKYLLGDDLKKVDVPSQIYNNGKFIDFPLSPLNLLVNIGLLNFTKAALEFLYARYKHESTCHIKDFESYSVYKYGKTIADNFLLNYSEKLWGMPCKNLSPNVSGSRIKGLDLFTFLIETFLGKEFKTKHLDGSFYYPIKGIGMITDKLSEICGKKNIKTNSRITKILHNRNRITGIEINCKYEVLVDEVVSTLPLGLFLKLLYPATEANFINLVNKIKYRNLILLAYFIDRDSITKNASLYFPSSDFIFTRMYEPKNRSSIMSPPGKTSLVFEIPCWINDELWNMDEVVLTQTVKENVKRIFGVKEEEIVGSKLTKINYAYPVLETGVENVVSEVISYLEQFDNLKITGRNGKFQYTHLHDMMRFGKDVVECYDLFGIDFGLIAPDLVAV